MDPLDVAGKSGKWCHFFGKLAVPQNIRHNPEISLVGIYPRVLKINVDVKTCIQVFIFQNSQRTGTT